MNRLKIAFVCFPLVLFLFGCNKVIAQEKQDSHENNVNYVSIAGLWTATSETALHFDDITLKATIYIRQIVPSGWAIQGCFMDKEQFCDYWPLSNFEYCDSSNQISFTDADGSVFIGTFNNENQRIDGMVYSTENDTLIPEDKLDLVRLKNTTPERLYTPRKPGDDGSVQYHYQIPKSVKDGWICNSIFNEVNDSVAFTDLMFDIINQEFGRIESFIIVKEGELLLEEYFYEYERTQLHNIYSCTKSIVSLLTGIALAEHNISGADTCIIDFFKGYEYLKTEEKGKITLHHVLTMSSGLKRINKQKFESVNALLDTTLSQPLPDAPGTTFQYHWNSPNLLGALLFSLTGETVDDYAKDKLFKPLGIKNYKWGYEFGVPDCHSNLYLLPRDMAKIGQLVLSNGNWKGIQLVPETWILQSTKPYVAESEFFNYGYQWWHRSGNNKSWWNKKEEQEEHDMIIALGFGGQYILIIRDLDLVISITSSDYNESNGTSFKKIPMVIEKVIPLFD